MGAMQVTNSEEKLQAAKINKHEFQLFYSVFYEDSMKTSNVCTS